MNKPKPLTKKNKTLPPPSLDRVIVEGTEKDMVWISLDEYNRLRDFEKDVNSNHSFWVVDDFCGRHLITINNSIESMAKKNEQLASQVQGLERLKTMKLTNQKQLTINKIKNIGLWKFLKIRFINK